VRESGRDARTRSFLLILCLVVMWLCVAIEWMFILLSMLGPFFPHPHLNAVMLGCYALLAVSPIFIRSHGLFVLLAGWIFTIACSFLWWHTTDEKSIPWFLYQNCLPLSFLLISHGRWLLTWKINKVHARVAP
jgi:hypothetical protein